MVKADPETIARIKAAYAVQERKWDESKPRSARSETNRRLSAPPIPMHREQSRAIDRAALAVGQAEPAPSFFNRRYEPDRRQRSVRVEVLNPV